MIHQVLKTGDTIFGKAFNLAGVPTNFFIKGFIKGFMGDLIIISNHFEFIILSNESATKRYRMLLTEKISYDI